MKRAQRGRKALCRIRLGHKFDIRQHTAATDVSHEIETRVARTGLV